VVPGPARRTKGGCKRSVSAEREDVGRRRGNSPLIHEHEVERRRAKKDGTAARDIKRESLDVIKRKNEMRTGRGMQYNIKGIPHVEVSRRYADEEGKGQMDGMLTEYISLFLPSLFPSQKFGVLDTLPSYLEPKVEKNFEHQTDYML
jgi:hypothetical protein